MAITKETKIIKTEIVGDYKAVQIAEDIIYKEDGVETNKIRHRRVLHPCLVSKNTDTGVLTTIWKDTSNETQEIKDIINAVWTDEIKTSWETLLKDRLK
jgi:hypothetical protein